MTTEKVFQFGKDNALFGIVTEPGADQGKRLPAVVILNAGLLHRVGPFRASVKLARRLAAAGHLVLRFDLSGLGDSEVRKDARGEDERALDDIREAMDFLTRKYGAAKFVLHGLCSGADYAHPMAVADPRIVGAVMLDGFGYRTPKWRSIRLKDIAFNMRKWRIRLERKLRKPFAAGRKETYVREFAPMEQVRTELEALTARGMNLLFIYTAGVPDYYNYKEQFGEMFGPDADFKGRIEVEFYGTTDHTYSRLQDREILLGRICAWMESRQWACPSAGLVRGSADESARLESRL